MIAAFIDVSCGGGWGPICTSAYVLNNTEPRKAVGIAKITEPIISLTSVVAFGILLGFENFLWSLALPMVIGGIFLTHRSLHSKEDPQTLARHTDRSMADHPERPNSDSNHMVPLALRCRIRLHDTDSDYFRILDDKKNRGRDHSESTRRPGDPITRAFGQAPTKRDMSNTR